MSNYNLEQNIKTLSVQYIEQEAIGSFLLLLISALDREKDQSYYNTIHNDILDLQYAVNQYILQMETILDDDADLRNSALEDCMDLKKKLLSIYQTVYQYTSIWNIYFTMISDEVAVRKYKEQNISHKKVVWDIFYMDCNEFLKTAHDVLEQKSRMGELLKCIPLHMARSKYYDIIKKSLQYSFSGESEEMITYSLNTFYHFFAPEKDKSYGKYFTELSQWLSSLKNIIPNTLSDEELNEQYTDFQSVFENLGNIEDMFHCIYNDINSLILLFYLRYTFSELTEQDIQYTDFYHTICEILTGELSETEKEAYFEQVYTSLENAVEIVIDKANDIGRKELEVMKKIKDFSSLSDDTKKILLTEDFIRSCYYGDLNEEVFHIDENTNLPPASQEWKEKAFDEFINNMKEVFSELPSAVRKASMQLLLCLLPPIFTVEETLSMIQYAIESSQTFEQKILIIDKVGMVFQDHGFQCSTDIEDSCGCGHEHHHHHHDCDCGHEHHHHHH